MAAARFLLALLLASAPLTHGHNVNRRAATLMDKENNKDEAPLLRSFEDFFNDPLWFNFKKEEPAGGGGGGGDPATPPTTTPTADEGEILRTVTDMPMVPNKPNPSAPMSVPNKSDQSSTDPDQPVAVPNQPPNPSAELPFIPNGPEDENPRVERNAHFFYNQGPNSQQGQQLREQLQTGSPSNSGYPQTGSSNTRFPQKPQQSRPSYYPRQQRPNFYQGQRANFYPGQVQHGVRNGRQSFSSGSTSTTTISPQQNQKLFLNYVLRDRRGTGVQQLHPSQLVNMQASPPMRNTNTYMTGHNSKPFPGSPRLGDTDFFQPTLRPSPPSPVQQFSAYGAAVAVAALSNMYKTRQNSYFPPSTTNPPPNHGEIPTNLPFGYNNPYPNINRQVPSAPTTPPPNYGGSSSGYPNGAGNPYPDDLLAVESSGIPNKASVPNKPAAYAL